MSVRSRLIMVAALIGAAGFVEPSAAAGTAAASPASCQDQFMLDRRDDPTNALKNLHRCSAVQEIGGNMENFTFWYVTLPAGSPAGEAASFDKYWKNNIAVLTSPGVGLGQQKAIAVLDDGIARGLTRGKRENLIGAWTGSHNPKVLAAAVPQKAAEPAVPAAKANPPAAAATAAKVVSAPAPYARRQPRPPVRHYARSNRSYATGSASSAMDAADPLQPADLGPAPTSVPAAAYSPVYAPFYPPSGPPPVYNAAAQPAYYPAIPPLIEAPLRAAGQALQQIDQGVQNVTHALIGRP